MSIRFRHLLIFFLFASSAAGQNALTVYNLNGDTLLDNNKYTNLQEAVNACPVSGCIIRVPTGTWPPAASNAALIINQSNVNIQCSGMGVSFISYTGTAAIAAVIDIGTSSTGTPLYVNDTINGCTVSGNERVQYAIRTRGVTRSDFSHNNLINVTVAGILTNFGVRLNLDDLHTSSNEQMFTTQPQSCIILDGPDHDHKTTTTSVGQPVCEGVSGTGIVLNNTADVTVHGGTSEQNNKGVTLSPGAVADTLQNLDTEINAISNIEDNGFQNRFINLTGNGLDHVLGAANSSHWTGYFYDIIIIDSEAVNTNLDHVGYNNSGTGSLTNNSRSTSKLRVANLETGIYDIDTLPGANGLSINGGTALTTTNQSGTGNLCMTTSCSMTAPTINNAYLNRPTIVGGVLLGMVGGVNAGAQTKRDLLGCTTAASLGGFCSKGITVTWGIPFADTNYSVICSPSGGPTNYPSPPFVTAKTGGGVTVNYFATTSAAASWFSIDCVAIHD